MLSAWKAKMSTSVASKETILTGAKAGRSRFSFWLSGDDSGTMVIVEESWLNNPTPILMDSSAGDMPVWQ